VLRQDIRDINVMPTREKTNNPIQAAEIVVLKIRPAPVESSTVSKSKKQPSLLKIPADNSHHLV